MESSQSFPSSTTEFSEVTTTTETNISPDLFSSTTLLSKITEALTETSTDLSTSTEWTTPKASISDLKFSVVDYSVFGIMLAMSGKIYYRTNVP